MGWNIRNVALETAEKLAIDIEKQLPIAPSRREVRIFFGVSE